MREKESQTLGRKPRGELVGGKTRIEREHSEERETLLQGRESFFDCEFSKKIDNLLEK